MRARDNPFRSERLAALAFRHERQGSEAIHERWRALGGRAAIVGPHGSGKTTLLRELGERCAREGLCVRHWFMNADLPRRSTRSLVREARRLGPRDVLLCDGAGHLPRPSWWRIARASRGAARVLVTAHAGGLLPTLVETRSDATLLRELTMELLGPDARSLHTLQDTLHERHDGNLHDVFLALYDLAARDDPRLVAG